MPNYPKGKNYLRLELTPDRKKHFLCVYRDGVFVGSAVGGISPHDLSHLYWGLGFTADEEYKLVGLQKQYGFPYYLAPDKFRKLFCLEQRQIRAIKQALVSYDPDKRLWRFEELELRK